MNLHLRSINGKPCGLLIAGPAADAADFPDTAYTPIADMLALAVEIDKQERDGIEDRAAFSDWLISQLEALKGGVGVTAYGGSVASIYARFNKRGRLSVKGLEKVFMKRTPGEPIHSGESGAIKTLPSLWSGEN